MHPLQFRLLDHVAVL
nr:unnamed protein product [Callosobruchus chinensis]